MMKRHVLLLYHICTVLFIYVCLEIYMYIHIMINVCYFVLCSMTIQILDFKSIKSLILYVRKKHERAILWNRRACSTKIVFSCFMLILLNFTFYIQLTLKNIKQSCHLYLLKKNNMHPYLKTSYFQLWYVKLSFFYFHFCLCVIWICLELMLSFVDFVFWYKAIGKSRVNPLFSCKMRGTEFAEIWRGDKSIIYAMFTIASMKMNECITFLCLIFIHAGSLLLRYSFIYSNSPVLSVNIIHMKSETK